MDFSGSSPEKLPLQEIAMTMTLIYMPSPKTLTLKTRQFTRLPTGILTAQPTNTSRPKVKIFSNGCTVDSETGFTVRSNINL